MIARYLTTAAALAVTLIGTVSARPQLPAMSLACAVPGTTCFEDSSTPPKILGIYRAPLLALEEPQDGLVNIAPTLLTRVIGGEEYQILAYRDSLNLNFQDEDNPLFLYYPDAACADAQVMILGLQQPRQPTMRPLMETARFDGHSFWAAVGTPSIVTTLYRKMAPPANCQAVLGDGVSGIIVGPAQNIETPNFTPPFVKR